MPKMDLNHYLLNIFLIDNDINPNGSYDVIAHGSWKEIEVNTSSGTKRIDARQAAKLIRRQDGFKKAKSIRILSCCTGAHKEGFAQHLAIAWENLLLHRI